MAEAPAGWYPDPDGPAGYRRYWDGQAWTEDVRVPLSVEHDPAPILPGTAEPQRLTISWAATVRKLFSFRLMLGAIVVAVVVGAVASLAWQPLAYIWIPTFLLVWVGGALNPLHVLYCPYCKKRVKAGADSCHHCGRVVVP